MSFALPYPPTPKICPVCGGKLVTSKQWMDVLKWKHTKKGGWRGYRHVFEPVARKRKVCKKCKIAVVVHRLRKDEKS